MSATRVRLSQLPRTVDLTIYAGDDFSMTLTVTEADGSPVDFSDASIWAQVRRRPDSPEVLGEFDVSAEEATILLRLSSELTARLPSRCVYDCEWMNRALTLIAGGILIRPEVTRDDG